MQQNNSAVPSSNGAMNSMLTDVRRRTQMNRGGQSSPHASSSDVNGPVNYVSDTPECEPSSLSPHSVHTISGAQESQQNGSIKALYYGENDGIHILEPSNNFWRFSEPEKERELYKVFGDTEGTDEEGKSPKPGVEDFAVLEGDAEDVSEGEEEPPAKSNMAANTAFSQNRMWAIQLIFKPFPTALTWFFVGCFLLLVGIVLMHTSARLPRIEIPYTEVVATPRPLKGHGYGGSLGRLIRVERNHTPCTYTSNDKLFSFKVNGNVVSQMGCLVKVKFELFKHIKPPVLLLYRLTNFNQPYRKYVESRSVEQLYAGSLRGSSDSYNTEKECWPLLYPGDLIGRESEKIVISDHGVNKTYYYRDLNYNPAGIVPWTMFNDSFRLSLISTAKVGSGNNSVLLCDGSRFSKLTNEPFDEQQRCDKKSIVWKSDLKKYNLPKFYGALEWTASKTVYVKGDSVEGNDVSNFTTVANTSSTALSTLQAERTQSDELPTSDNAYYNNGWYAHEPGHSIPYTTDNDFITWARMASKKNFDKLYRIIHDSRLYEGDSTGKKANKSPAGLVPGIYEIEITELFDTSHYNGHKSFVIAAANSIGVRDAFLAYAYTYSGVAVIVVTLLAYIVELFFFRNQRRRRDEEVQRLTEDVNTFFNNIE